MTQLRSLIAALVLMVALVGCSAANAPESDESSTPTVGIVNIASILDSVVDGLELGMGEFDYTEGENVTYIYNGAVSRDDLEAEIQSLIDQEVDVIVSLTTPATVTTKEMTAENQIPVVFVPVNDPLGAGIVSDLTNPGENITGIISGASEIRRMEWLLTVAPGVQRIYFPYNPEDSSPVQTLEAMEEIAPDLGIELVTFEVATVELLEEAVSSMPDDIDAIYLPSDSRVGSALTDWIALAEERGIPMSGSSQAHVDAGVLSSYSYSPFEAGRQAARLVDQILDGVDPGTLPVETAEPLFSINLIAAEAIGLEVSDNVLVQANIIVRNEEE